MANETLSVELSYSWLPFTVDGAHLRFTQHCGTRLDSARCSHWGPAVYKWEGRLATGPQAGKVGVLIGETGDLRQRIKQYVAGTQERGNRLWRETFLSKGTARLFVLDLKGLSVNSGGNARTMATTELLQSNNRRLVLEQLLVMEAVSRAGDSTWIVNARQ
jgi:hypothetical protein